MRSTGRILLALFLVSATANSATLSDLVIPSEPENTALYVDVRTQSDRDGFDSIAISLLVIAALGFVRRTNSHRTPSKAPKQTNNGLQRVKTRQISRNTSEAEAHLV